MGVYLDEDKINKFHLLALKEKKKLFSTFVMSVKIFEVLFLVHSFNLPMYQKSI